MKEFIPIPTPFTIWAHPDYLSGTWPSVNKLEASIHREIMLYLKDIRAGGPSLDLPEVYLIMRRQVYNILRKHRAYPARLSMSFGVKVLLRKWDLQISDDKDYLNNFLHVHESLIILREFQVAHNSKIDRALDREAMHRLRMRSRWD